jgi:hypothetical protein
METIKTICILMIYFRTFGRKRKYALGKLPVRLISKKSSRVRIKTKCGRSKISYPKNY